MKKNSIDQLEPSFFFFQLPLYSEVKVTLDNAYPAKNHLNYHEHKEGRRNNIQKSIRIDGYNPLLGEKTTYAIVSSIDLDIGEKLLFGNGGQVHLSLKCTRSDQAFHFFLLSKAKDNKYFSHYTIGDEDATEIESKKEVYISKIGQYPSLADFHVGDYKKYKKALPEDKLKELVKGCRLSASGVGIGSFVYLRRIFEHLIFEAFEANKIHHEEWNIEEFKKLRMDQKIPFIKDYLPSLLVEHSSLYGILSIGLHSLSDELCNEQFPIVRTGIELILDQKLQTIKQRNKETQFKRDVDQLTRKLKTK